jgi:hypothetical protein
VDQSETRLNVEGTTHANPRAQYSCIDAANLFHLQPGSLLAPIGRHMQ